MSNKASRQIGRYEIKSKLGEGAMALVLRAYDPMFKRDVALKVLRRSLAQNEVIRKRFLREARAIAQLDHPAIVPIYDAGQDGNYTYYVMRLMDGGTLHERIEEGVLSIDDIASILKRLASALDASHAIDIVHRDVKPENIMFDRYGSAYLADFGIIKRSAGNTMMTQDTLLGTPAYMSPEQVHGREVDGRSDIYSLGAVMFEMLTGNLPFQADSAMGMAMAQVMQPVPSLRDTNPNLSQALDAVVATAMAKKPEDRFPTGEELVSAFDSATISTTRTSLDGTVIKQKRNSRTVISLVAALLVIALGWGGWSLFGPNRGTTQETSPDEIAAQLAAAEAEVTTAAEREASLATQDALYILETATAIAEEIRAQLADESTAVEDAVAETLTAVAPNNTATPEPTTTPEPTATPTEPPTATPRLERIELEEISASVPRLRVAVSSVNLRKGPGTVYEAVGFVTEGEELEIIGRNQDADWFEVSLANNQTAWVASTATELLDAEPEAIALAEVPPVPTRTPTPTATPNLAATRTAVAQLTQQVIDATSAAQASANQATSTAAAARTAQAVAANRTATASAQAATSVAAANATATREAQVANFEATQTRQAQNAQGTASAIAAAQTATASAPTATSTLPPPTATSDAGDVATAAPPTEVPTPTTEVTATSEPVGTCADNEATVQLLVQWGSLRMAGATVRLEAFSGGAVHNFTTDSGGFARFCFGDLGKWVLGASVSTDFGTADSVNYAPDSRPIAELKAGEQTGYTIYVAHRDSFSIITPTDRARYTTNTIEISWEASGYPHVAVYDVVWRDMLATTLYQGSASVPSTQNSVTIDTGLPSHEKNEICFRLQILAYDSGGTLLGWANDLSRERFCVQLP